MRISKAGHLKRLLQTQDVLIASLTYCVVVDAGWLAGYYTGDTAVAHMGLLPFVIGLSVFAAVSQTPRLHGTTFWVLVWQAARHAVLVVTGTLGIAYFSHVDWVSRYVVGGFGALLLLALVVNRLFLGWWYFRRRVENPDNFLKVLVIGSGSRARRLMENYRRHSDWGIDLVGILDPKPEEGAREVDGVPLLGNLNAIRDVLSSCVIDEVVV
jgi:FlaA1/EpsC-like NDP-sugar epimerase